MPQSSSKLWLFAQENLGLVCLALVGHALRERSPGHAFAAGLVANVAVVGGYALAVVTSGGRLDEVQVVRLLQLGSLGAGVWALAWLLANPVVTAPIVGPRKMEQLTESLRAPEIILSEEQRKRLDEIWPGPGGESPEAFAW